jgi:hypothetical protein
MGRGVDVSDVTLLCHAPSDLAEHVVQLLADSGISAQQQAAGDAVAILIPATDIERGRATIALVLPQLLTEEPTADTVKLSDRLVRSEPPPQPELRLPRLIDGRAALSGESSQPTEEWHEDHHDEFVPPAPPDIPQPKDRISRFAWGGVVLGPLLLLLTAVLGLPNILTTAGLAAFIVGFGTLVARREETPREGWDDGAVV